MRIKENKPSRVFTVKDVTLSHVADIELAPDELVTFQGSDGQEFDFTAKEWGFYVTGSTNGRLKKAGYRTLIAENEDGMRYILSYENPKEDIFLNYLAKQKMKIISYLDEKDINS